MLTEYTTPGASVEVRDDESIYSLLTERIKRTGEDTVIAERKPAFDGIVIAWLIWLLGRGTTHHDWPIFHPLRSRAYVLCTD